MEPADRRRAVRKGIEKGKTKRSPRGGYEGRAPARQGARPLFFDSVGEKGRRGEEKRRPSREHRSDLMEIGESEAGQMLRGGSAQSPERLSTRPEGMVSRRNIPLMRYGALSAPSHARPSGLPVPGASRQKHRKTGKKKSDEEHTTSDQDSLSASDGGTIPRRRRFVKHCLKKRYRKRRKSPLSPCPETLRATISGRSAAVPRYAGRFRLSEKDRGGFPPAYFPLQNRNEPATAGETCPAKRTKPKRTENASNRP